MTGFVDDRLRALLRVPVSASRDRERRDLVAWIDTAFNGGLAIPRQQVAELALVKESSAEAVLADGHSVELETFACFVHWFSNSYQTQIVASDGDYPLLGTMLLDGHRCMYARFRRLAQMADWSERPTPRGCPCVEPLPNGDRSPERELVVLLGRRGARTIFWGAAALAPQPVGPGKRSAGFDPLELFGAVSY